MSPEQINWDDPNLDLDKVLGISDIDKEEGFYSSKSKINNIISDINIDTNNIIENFSDLAFFDTIEYLENQLKIKIKYGEKGGGYIKLLTKNNDLIGKIWADNYILENNIIDENHLGIEVYGEYQGKNFSNILYDLYKKYSIENDNIFYPDIDFATKNSRISLLIKQGYVLKEKYINGFFIPISEGEIDDIMDDIKNDFYGKQEYSYKFILED